MNQFNVKEPSILMILGGNVLAIIGCFLPFVSIFGFGVSYFEGDGKIVAVLCVVGIILALVKAKIAWVTNVIALIVTFVAIFRTASMSLELLGIGAYIVVIANIVAIIGSIKAKKIA